jgi:hypothetical protein
MNACPHCNWRYETGDPYGLVPVHGPDRDCAGSGKVPIRLSARELQLEAELVATAAMLESLLAGMSVMGRESVRSTWTIRIETRVRNMRWTIGRRTSPMKAPNPLEVPS